MSREKTVGRRLQGWEEKRPEMFMECRPGSTVTGSKNAAKRLACKRSRRWVRALDKLKRGEKQVNGLFDYDTVFVGFQGFGTDAGDLNNILGGLESSVGFSKLNDAIGIFWADAFK